VKCQSGRGRVTAGTALESSDAPCAAVGHALETEGGPSVQLETSQGNDSRRPRNPHPAFRDECLNVQSFLSTKDPGHKIEQWRCDHNELPPHSSLADLTPRQFPHTYTCSIQYSQLRAMINITLVVSHIYCTCCVAGTI